MRVTITLSATATAAFSAICASSMYQGIPVANVAAAVFNAGLADWENSFVGRYHANQAKRQAAAAAASGPKSKKKGKS